MFGSTPSTVYALPAPLYEGQQLEITSLYQRASTPTSSFGEPAASHSSFGKFYCYIIDILMLLWVELDFSGSS